MALKRADMTWPMLVLRKHSRIVGCAGVWDQRACRQVVIRGYSSATARLRPFYNLAAPLHGRPRLPAVGTAIPQAFLSPLLLEDESDWDGLALLLRSARALAAQQGLGVLTLGLAADHPWRTKIPRMARAIEYCTRLYGVHWGEVQLPTGSLPMPEASLL